VNVIEYPFKVVPQIQLDGSNMLELVKVLSVPTRAAEITVCGAESTATAVQATVSPTLTDTCPTVVPDIAVLQGMETVALCTAQIIASTARRV
jgi:hypothetical protein